MFDIGFQEMIMIFVVALLVIGPKRLPEAGKTIGKGLGELKRSFEGVKVQLEAEMKEVEKKARDNDPIGPPAPCGTAQDIAREKDRSAGSETGDLG